MAPTRRSFEDTYDESDSDENYELEIKKVKRRKRRAHKRRDIASDEPIYCHCETESYGRMIQCDNDLCPMVWFHFKCVNITHKPKGKWYCLLCRARQPNRMKSKDQLAQQLIEYNKMQEGV